jgi:hypothetical protein
MSQQDKITLQSNINSQLADNTSGDISAADVRNNLINITDSLVFNNGNQSITGSLIATSFTGSLQGTAEVASKVSTINVGGGGTFYPLIASSFSGNVSLYSTPNAYKYILDIDQLVVSSISASSGFTGSLQGTATTASYVLNAVSASRAATSSLADVATKLTITGAGGVGTLYPTLVGISAGNLDVSTKVSNLSFNQTTNQLFATSVSSSFTGSLLGTATTASYAATASVLLGGVVSSSYAATASVLLGSVTSASYASTSSLSNETMGAGNPSNTGGGEIQFRGPTTPGGSDGKTIYSSAFIWDGAYNGLVIGDPNTTFPQNGGNYYIQVGTDAVSAGNYSVSFGSSSYAQGEGSFTHGKTVTAAGSYSHAEGTNTQSPGNFSHAEGATTTSWGIGSHAEGNNTTANGDYSHTEGQNAITNGAYSHAEGSSTVATGANSHAEGANTLASASFSHAEGRFTVSRGQYSHAEGFYTTASALYSHAEGSGSVALGVASHAEGQFTIASGSYQHVEGRFNTQGDNTSLLIVGNGTSNASRSDAFKVRMSGSIVLPTTQSAAPSWTGTDGEMVFATVTGNHFFYVWMAGTWRSGSLV